MAYTGWFRELFSKAFPILIIFVVVALSINLYMQVFMFYFTYTDESEMLTQFKLQLPQLANYSNQFGIFCHENTSRSRNFILSLIILIMVFFCMGTSLYLHFYFKLLQNKLRSGLNDKTVKLQFMLFKAVGVQLTIGYLFLLFPIVISYSGFYLQYKNASTVSAICMMLITFHGCLDYVTIIYFITPYRRAVVKMGYTMLNILTNKQIVPSTNTTMTRRSTIFTNGISL